MIGFLDCYSGISGDMLLGALVDVGVPLPYLSATLAGLSLAGYVGLEAREVQRGGLHATKVDVAVSRARSHRTLHEIAALLDASGLHPDIRERSLRVLGRLAEVEGRIHGEPAEQVELHEVGAVDSIADVVGSVAGFAFLGVDRLFTSALPGSPGSIAGGHHEHLPTPAPATLALLAAASTPLRPFGDGRELVTPTGAAIVTTLTRFGQPAMRLQRVGYGAGLAELPWPNVLRLWIGEEIPPDAVARDEECVVLETNIDDMSPQLLAPVTGTLLAAGALDVSISPLVMKKGRSGSLVSVIARNEDENALALLLLRHTTTLGVRVHRVRRHEARRAFETVNTRYGQVTVKLKLLGTQVIGAMPEFESVRELAATTGVPLLEVHAAAAAAAEATRTTIETRPD